MYLIVAFGMWSVWNDRCSFTKTKTALNASKVSFPEIEGQNFFITEA